MADKQGGGATVVRGGVLVDPSGTRDGDVLIEDGAISAVGTVEAPAGAREIDATGRYVTAGLINSHYHSGENFNPGLYENLPLDLWFVHSHQVTRTEPPSPDVIYARTMLGAMLIMPALASFLFRRKMSGHLEPAEPTPQA